MSTPDQPTAELASGIATSVQQGPDGKAWGVLHIQTPLLQCSWFLPVDAITALAAQLPAFLTELAEKVQMEHAKTNNGLVLSATMDDAKTAQAVNDLLKGKRA